MPSLASKRRMTSFWQHQPSKRRLPIVDAAMRRRIYPGFPWVGKFETIEEINEYLSRETVTCLMCGREFIVLNGKHFKLHSMTNEDYRNRFGIPWKTGLTGINAHNKMRETAINRITKGTLNKGNPGYGGKHNNRPIQPCTAFSLSKIWRKGSKNSMAKLTEQLVTEIKQEIIRGAHFKSIAAKYKVSKALIYQIHKGKIWGHV